MTSWSLPLLVAASVVEVVILISLCLVSQMYKEEEPGQLFNSKLLDLVFVTAFRTVGSLICSVFAFSFRVRENQCDKAEVAPVNGSESIHVGSTQDLEDPLLVPPKKDTDTKEHLSFLKSKKRISIKNKLTYASLLVHIGVSLYVAAKAINFKYSRESIQAPLLTSLAFVGVVEFFLLKRFQSENIFAIGYVKPHIHHHKLFYRDKQWVWCNICDKGQTGYGFECKTCSYNVCYDCFKNTKQVAEGVDFKGKLEAEVSSYDFIRRTFGMGEKKAIFIPLIFILVFSYYGSRLALPHFSGTILDNVYQNDTDEFWKNLKMMFIITFSSAMLHVAQSNIIELYGITLEAKITSTLFHSIIYQDISFFDGIKTGTLTSRLTTDAWEMCSPWSIIFNSFFGNVLYLGGGLLMCMHTSWRLSIIALCSIGPAMYVNGEYAEWAKLLRYRMWGAYEQVQNLSSDSFNNIRTVRAFSTENVEEEKVKKAIAEIYKLNKLEVFVRSCATAFTSAIDSCASILIIGYGGHLAMNDPDELTPGNLIAFQFYWNMLSTAASGLSDVLTSLTTAAGAAMRVISLLDNLPSIDPEVGLRPAKLVGDLQLENVSFTYRMRPDSQVLNNVTLTIPAGKTTALVGRSGGGKSTIMHMLMRFYDPVENKEDKGVGTVHLDGIDLKELNLLWYHRQIGIVSQEAHLFAASIYENITYGLHPSEYSMEDVIEAAKLAHAHAFISKMECGYETKVGERGSRLSGGQKQRIAIARTLLRKPKLLFLDEATSALDNESEKEVQKAIDNLMGVKGLTVVLIAHRLSTVVDADQVAVVDEGKIVQLGTHNELVKEEGSVYAKLVASQFNNSKKIPESIKKDDSSDDCSS